MTFRLQWVIIKYKQGESQNKDGKMSKFKKGDLVEVVEDCVYFKAGEKIIIDENNSTIPFGISALGGLRKAVDEDKLKLADPNPMPELEAGMVVEYESGDVCVWVSADIQYYAWRKGANHNDIGVNNCIVRPVVKVYSKTDYGLRSVKKFTTENNPIWTRTTEKTEEEIKKEKALDRIATLEDELSKLKEEI